MPCDPLIEPACIIAGRIAQSAASSAAGDVLSGLAQAISDGVRWTVANTATWWIKIGSPDLATEPAVARMQQWLLPVTAAVAAAGMIAAGARIAITRKGSPLLDVTGGLVTIAATATIGVTAVTLLLKAGDAWSAWILQQSTGGQFTERLTMALNLGGGTAPVVVIVFGIAAIILSVVQAALMLFRQAALVILAGVLPLAGAGSIAPMTRGWIRKVAAWMLALIFYKPAAAAVYAAAFTMIGTGGTQTALMGFVMLVLSVVALPALLRFFTWTTGAIGGPSGGGQILGAAAAGAIALGALRSSGGRGAAAQEQAAYLSSRLGAPSGGGSDGGATGTASGGPGSPSGGPVAPSGAGAAGPGSGRPANGGAPSVNTPGVAPSASAGGPAGAGAGPTAASPRATGTGAATSATSTGAAGAAPTGSAAPAAGPAAGAGSAGAAAAAGSQAAQAAARLAAGAMTTEDPPDGS